MDVRGLLHRCVQARRLGRKSTVTWAPQCARARCPICQTRLRGGSPLQTTQPCFRLHQGTSLTRGDLFIEGWPTHLLHSSGRNYQTTADCFESLTRVLPGNDSHLFLPLSGLPDLQQVHFMPCRRRRTFESQAPETRISLSGAWATAHLKNRRRPLELVDCVAACRSAQLVCCEVSPWRGCLGCSSGMPCLGRPGDTPTHHAGSCQ